MLSHHSFFVLRSAVPSITLLRKPQSEKLRGSGGSAPSSNFALQLFNMDGVAGSQATPNSVQFTVAVLFVTQVFAPLRRRILAGKQGRSFQIRSGFNQVVENLNPVLRIPADCEIVNEENLNPCSPYADLLKMDSSSKEKVLPL